MSFTERLLAICDGILQRDLSFHWRRLGRSLFPAAIRAGKAQAVTGHLVEDAEKRAPYNRGYGGSEETSHKTAGLRPVHSIRAMDSRRGLGRC